jgi:uncharacterized protein YydD (DUF2326 family)
MLKEIKCDQFIEPIIEFNNGLNSVLGDDISTNSIGKSTLLMIIDFVFGGNTFINKNSGSIEHLGDLTFKFKFKFGNVNSHYLRQTANPDVISLCDNNYNPLNEITLKEYTSILLENYGIKYSNISFRDIVGLFSRIWGKDNYSVDKPLLSFLKEADELSITRIIKLFERQKRFKEIFKWSHT